MKKWVDTLKRVTKTVPLAAKIAFILAMVLQFVVFLVGEATLVYTIKFEACAIFLYLFYVTVFHTCRMFNEEQVLEYLELMGGNSKNG